MSSARADVATAPATALDAAVMPASVPTTPSISLITPTRAADLRVSGFGEAQCFSVVGAGVPSGAAAVFVNVVAVSPRTVGNVVLYPASAGGAPPTASTVNFETDRDVAAAALVPVGLGDSVCAYAQSYDTTRVLVDILGYTLPGSPLTGVAATRLVDTRPGSSAATSVNPLPRGQAVKVNVAGVAGVPAGAKAVLLSVTAVQPATIGNLRVYPWVDGGAPSPTATLNYAPGQTKTNGTLVSLGVDGAIAMYSDSASDVSVDVVVDVVGYMSTSSEVVSVQPARLLDTRASAPVDQRHGVSTLAAGVPVQIDLASVAPNLPSGVTGLVLNVTAVGPTSIGNLRVYSGSGTPPEASSLNYIPGRDVANLVVAGVSGGVLTLYSDQPAGQQTDVTVDLFAYVVGTAVAPGAGSSTPEGVASSSPAGSGSSAPPTSDDESDLPYCS